MNTATAFNLQAMKCIDDWRLRGRRSSPENIIKIVSEYYELPYSTIKSRSRRSDICWARQVICFMIINNSRTSSVSVGKLIGRDHATVLHALKAVNNAMDTQPKIRVQIKEIGSKII